MAYLFWAAIDWVGRGQVLWGIFSTLMSGAGGGLVAAMSDLGPPGIFLWIMVGAAAGAVVYIAFVKYWENGAKTPNRDSATHEGSAQTRIFPDWPIDELFTHLNPVIPRKKAGVVSPEDHWTDWDAVGVQIRDALALGRLRSWGRTIDTRPNVMDSLRPPLSPIEPGFWQIAEFTYDFFDSTAGDKPHTTAPTNAAVPQYTDLRVNRAQALQIWPSRPAAPDDLKTRIAQARKFVGRTLASRPGDSDYFKAQLETDIAFLNLEPHLSGEFLSKLRAQRTLYVPREGTNRPALADWFLDELKRLERLS